MDYDDVYSLFFNVFERAACDFLEYMDRPPLPLTCYVDIPAGPDYYVPEIDGYDEPAEIMKY